MKSLLTVAVGLALVLTACKEPAPLTEGASFQSVDADGWAYGQMYEFNPEPAFSEPDGTARIAIAVRHSDAYLYSNLWLELATPVAGTDSMRLDTVNVPLADVYGKWLGRGVGVSYMTSDTLPGRYAFDDKIPARVRHIMRVDTLKDIEQIGLIYFDAAPAHK